MIDWSLEALGGCEAVVIAVPPGFQFDSGGLELVEGGATRAESVSNALAAVETELVAVHDAARPLVTPELVKALVAELDGNPEAQAVVPAAAVTDTVKKSKPTKPVSMEENVGLVVETTVDRSRLWAVQTPQVFRTAALRAALAVDQATRDAATDEAMLIEAAGGIVLLHEVSEPNFKVTTPLDLRIAGLLLAERA